MASATLETIRKKIRRLTHSPSPSQISTAEIDEYINTFYQYDFPEHLRLMTAKTPVSIQLDPYFDRYSSQLGTLSFQPTYGENFDDTYTSVHPPVYVDGQPVYFTQDPAEFYGIYPKNKTIVDTGLVGDGVTTSFSGTLSSKPIAPGTVMFSTVTDPDSSIGLILEEVIDDAGDFGVLTGQGTGTINNITGAYTLNFTFAPSAGAKIKAHSFPYTAGRPRAVLYYNNEFTVRPIPDDSYTMEIQGYRTYTDLVNNGDSPRLKQWWQYIAYGASKKIFEDRMDIDSVNLLMPEFRKQEALVLRKSLVQQSNERVATIYTDASRLGGGFRDPNMF